LTYLHKAFSQGKDNMKNVKGKIIDNINNIDTHLANIKKYKTYHKQLSTLFKEISTKSHDAQKETRLVFKELKSRKLLDEHKTSHDPYSKLYKKTHHKIRNLTETVNDERIWEKQEKIESKKSKHEKSHKHHQKKIQKHDAKKDKEIPEQKIKTKEKLSSKQRKRKHKALVTIYDKIAEEITEVVAYRKDLNKVHKVLHSEEEAIIITRKVVHCNSVLKYLQKLIKYTRFSIVHLRYHREMNDFYNQGLIAIIEKLKQMKSVFKNANGNEKEMSKIDIAGAKSKIHKLAELYQYLRKDAFHEYVRSQILKKVINMNVSVLTKVDLRKHLSCLIMKKSLIKRFNKN